jgi:tRNA threonylcarbamoyladenosine biosynthesis protein TsaE
VNWSEFQISTPEDLLPVAKELLAELKLGDVVCLDGPLGAGKTTFVRTALGALGFLDSVRSPTFNILQTFETEPPVLHADLYRLANAEGFGLEDLLPDYISFIEWPDRLQGLIDPDSVYWVEISFTDTGRQLRITRPV